MARITVTYYLTKEGQKKDLLEGGDGRECQKVDLEYVGDDLRKQLELREQIIELGQIDSEGNVSLVIGDGGSSFSEGRRVGRAGWEPRLVQTRVDRTAPDEWNLPTYRREEFALYDHYEPRSVDMPIDFDTPQSLEYLLTFETERREASGDEAKARCEAMCAHFNLAPQVVEHFEAAEQRVEAALLKAKHEVEAEREWLAERKAKREAEEVGREAWVREYGSAHLKMILEEGMLDNSLALYRNERLAKERPGWIWDADWIDGEVEYRDPRNPSLDVIAWLREARQTVPNAQLRWAHYGTYDNEGRADPVREMVLISEFLERTIVLRRDADD